MNLHSINFMKSINQDGILKTGIERKCHAKTGVKSRFCLESKIEEWSVLRTFISRNSHHPTRYCIFTMQYNSNDALLTFDYGAMLIAGILRMQEALAEEERSASYASFWCVDVPIETQNLLLFVGDMTDGIWWKWGTSFWCGWVRFHDVCPRNEICISDP